jgi:hypothetical protein
LRSTPNISELTVVVGVSALIVTTLAALLVAVILWPRFYYGAGRLRARAWFYAYRTTPFKLADLRKLLLNLPPSARRGIIGEVYCLNLAGQLIAVSAHAKSLTAARILAAKRFDPGKIREIDNDALVVVCDRLPNIVQLTLIPNGASNISVVTENSTLPGGSDSSATGAFDEAATPASRDLIASIEDAPG